jgi:hypothetical protein
MRKLLLQLVIAMVVACGLVQAAPGASSPPTAHALSAYLAKMARLNAAVVQAENAQIKASNARPKKRTNNTDPGLTRRALIATLLRTSSAMKRIVPPAVLKSPHAAFVSSLQLEAQGANSKANALRTRWRQAATLQLRRAGLAIPHWVTQVRDPFA